ncbi:hypothetical protein ACFQZO_14075 [Bradyrhizobium sp. GCM10027634]|nr:MULTISPECIES: hypothetical protein [unclassified Bradyrhizobium]MDN5002016.1 hypothetical protein [Bradyrhizobium sp. WYCCWR 12677]
MTAVAATLSGVLNAMGWLAAAIYLFGSAGCTYFLTTQAKLSAA